MIVDGRRIPLEPGASILEAAHAAGIAIPGLCHHDALPVDRSCLVEIEGRPRLHPACVVPATKGLHVRTETADVRADRANVLRLLLRRYRPGIGREGNELLALAARYAVTAPVEDPAEAIAVGLALTDRLRGRAAVTACFFGDGAVAEGEFHESLNLAALWRLPVLFLCENNLYAMGTALERHQAQADIVRKAEALLVDVHTARGE